MKNIEKKFFLLFICIGIALPIQGMKQLLQRKLLEGSQRIKQIPLPARFEPHKKMLTEPWQFSDPTWRKDVLEPTIGSTIQTAMWASLSYAVGIPIYIIRLDNITNGLKKSWEYMQNYFASSHSTSLPLSDKDISKIELPKKIDE